VYNGERYLREAIDSILVQSFTDFELLMMNDGSTDKTVEIIKSYSDSRIRLITNEENLKLPDNLNKGIQLAQGKYIARMDADDISLPQRLQRQVDFMERNPEIGMCGTWAQEIDIDGNVLDKIREYPVHHEDIAYLLFDDFTLLHPTILFRKDAAIEHKLFYDSAYLHAEDYDLFFRASQVIKLANLPEVLFYYRQHPLQVSQKHYIELRQTVSKVQMKHLLHTFKEISLQEADLHHQLIVGQADYTLPVIRKIDAYLLRLLELNAQKRAYPEQVMRNHLSGLWILYFFQVNRFSIKTYRALSQSHFFEEIKPADRIKLLCKCLIGWKGWSPVEDTGYRELESVN
jgi:glycosyltransferase involved in cell wall biosynthesis